jgi:hypothetical protein
MSPGRDLNPGLPKYEALLTSPTRLLVKRSAEGKTGYECGYNKYEYIQMSDRKFSSNRATYETGHDVCG